jgi:ABC-type antimicrobial peptide transport system permease subunit
MNVVVRSRTDPEILTATLRQTLRAVDPDLPMFRVRTMAARVDESLAQRRFLMVLLAIFAGLALGLATIGTYGVLAYLVSQGRRELAIRMALGATARDVVRLVAGHGLAIAGAGVAAGLTGAFAAAWLLDAVLFDVQARDPLTFAAVAVTIGLVALAASVAPALRAARIDPARTLSAD